MPNIRIIHIDDCNSYLATFKQVAGVIPGLELIGSFQIPELALEFVENHKPDMVFLDLEMGHINGLNLIQEFNDRGTNVVVHTAYNEYAINACNTGVYGYLLKPLNPDDVKSTVQRWQQARSLQEQLNTSSLHENSRLFSVKGIADTLNYPKRLIIPMIGQSVVIKLDDLVMIEAKSNYSVFTLKSGITHTSSINLKVYEDIIGGHPDFMRVYRSYIINKNYITHIVKNSNTKVYVVLENNRKLKIAYYKRDEILQALTI